MVEPTTFMDGDVLGVRLLPDPPGILRRPGRGDLARAGQAVPIQVAA